jgi:hypothetical protein
MSLCFDVTLGFLLFVMIIILQPIPSRATKPLPSSASSASSLTSCTQPNPPPPPFAFYRRANENERLVVPRLHSIADCQTTNNNTKNTLPDQPTQRRKRKYQKKKKKKKKNERKTKISHNDNTCDDRQERERTPRQESLARTIMFR